MNESPFAHLHSLIAKGAVQDIVDAFVPQGGMSFACLIGDDCHAFSSRGEGLVSADSQVDIGCLMKNLTSLLVAIAESEGRLALEDPVARFFPEHTGIDTAVRVFHLLNQSHGLDGSALNDVPYTCNGLIDSGAIWNVVCASPRISHPGSMFYYWGNVGFWLAGAILERIYGCMFTSLLREKILANIEHRVQCGSGGPVCPASGGITLSAKELLQLCRIHLRHLRSGERGNSIRRLGLEFNVLIPRWPLAAERIGNGWFIFTGSMLGASGTSASIIVSPGENAAFALTGTELHAARRQLLGKLAVAPNTQRPRLLTKEAARGQNREAFIGLYRKASLTLEIYFRKHGQLWANVYRCRAGGGYEGTPFIVRTLLPSEENTFFPLSPEKLAIPFIRFERPDQKGHFEYADSSMHIFRRVQ